MLRPYSVPDLLADKTIFMDFLKRLLKSLELEYPEGYRKIEHQVLKQKKAVGMGMECIMLFVMCAA